MEMLTWLTIVGVGAPTLALNTQPTADDIVGGLLWEDFFGRGSHLSLEDVSPFPLNAPENTTFLHFPVCCSI